MKNNDIDCTGRHYWVIGNSIDGVCCHPQRQRMTEPELIAYLETQFLIDFNASRGEFDFTIYLDRQGFRLHQRYGYYLEGPRRSVVARVDYMTSLRWDSAHQIVQQYEDTTASWIHAVLHKIEGDDHNSRYWYRRAGKLEHVSDEPTAELAVIRQEVAARA